MGLLVVARLILKRSFKGQLTGFLYDGISMTFPNASASVSDGFDEIPVAALAAPASDSGPVRLEPVEAPVVAQESAQTPASPANPIASPTADTPASNNPYAAPIAGVAKRPVSADRAKILSIQQLRKINRWLCFTGIAGLIWTASLIVSVANPSFLSPAIQGLGLMFGVLGSWACVTVLAYLTGGLGCCIGYGLFFLCPIFNFFLMLAQLEKARKILRRHGFKFGVLFMAEDPKAYDLIVAQQSTASDLSVKPRSEIATVITYAIIGLLLGMIAISFLA